MRSNHYQSIKVGVEFIPTGHTRLQFGDLVTVIGSDDDKKILPLNLVTQKRVAGTKYRQAFFPGIGIGVLFGSIPIVFPGVPVPVKLGLAGGPLIIAIFISRYGSVIPVISYVTQALTIWYGKLV